MAKGKVEANVTSNGLKWTIIDESEAPAEPVGKVSGPNPNQQLALDLLAQLKDGNVGRIGLDEGDSVRAIKRGITTVANRQNKAVSMWVDDSVLYVKLDGEAKPKSKAREKAQA